MNDRGPCLSGGIYGSPIVLTPIRSAITAMVAYQMSTREIAHALGITRQGVQDHLRSIRRVIPELPRIIRTRKRRPILMGNIDDLDPRTISGIV